MHLIVGTRRVVVITGASSGLGLSATKALTDKGGYFVIAAVRDPAKMDAVAKEYKTDRSLFSMNNSNTRNRKVSLTQHIQSPTIRKARIACTLYVVG